MHELFGIYCTDGIAKDNTRLAISALDDMVWQGAEGRPLGISHDFHRFIGWNVITGLYMSHEQSYVVGSSFLPENEEEMKTLQMLRNGFYFDMVDKAFGKYKDAFLDILIKQDLVDPHAHIMFNGLAMYGYEGILDRAFPNLKSLCDNDSLIKVEELLKDFDYLGQGVFAHKGSSLTVMLHPYFRRSFSRYNNYNFGFLDQLWNVYQGGNKSVKVLLDPDYIGYAPSFIQCHEYEYWYGPLYNDDISKIPEGLCHMENEDELKLYNNVKSTEFIWQKKDGGKKYQFEMEEVVDITLPALPEDTYGCRYLHAFYDFDKAEFDHFDGAIRCYDWEQMISRIDTTMDKMGHHAKYQKIFRLDGHIPLDRWKGLITQYLCSNPLIYDYFGIKRPFSAKKKESKSVNEWNNYVPFILNRGDGVRLLVSYTNEVVEDGKARSFMTVDQTTLEDGEKTGIAEFATIEVFKALNKVGAEISLPENIVYHLSEDYYHFIPCIHHSKNDLSDNLYNTLQGLRLLVSQHVKNGDNDRYSFSLSWVMDERLVCIAFMGHVDDLNQWLQTFDRIPTDRQTLKRWLDVQNTYIHANGRDSVCPIDNSFIKNDGMLFFQRHDIKEHVEIQSIAFDPKIGFHGEILIDNNEFLKDKLMSGELVFVPKFVVYDALDLNTNTSYLQTSNSVIFKETSYRPDAKVMGFNWVLSLREI